MPKKKRGDSSPDSEFTAAVIGRVRRLLAGMPQHTATDTLEVRQVANGIAFIQQCLRRSLDEAKSTEDRDALTSTGLSDAIALMDSLMTGRQHPVQRYVNGLKSTRYRPNAAGPNKLDEIARLVMVGAVQRMKEVGISETQAAKLVAQVSSSKERIVSPDQIKGWKRRLNDEHVVAARNTIAAKAAKMGPDWPDQEAVLAVTRDMLARFWAVAR